MATLFLLLLLRLGSFNLYWLNIVDEWRCRRCLLIDLVPEAFCQISLPATKHSLEKAYCDKSTPSLLLNNDDDLLIVVL